jgi:cAMP-binding proteins - catabolite gene activator and regulatory subunit of cAMP-dependent protein kinases
MRTNNAPQRVTEKKTLRTKNQILSQLDEPTLAQVAHALKEIELPSGEIIFRPDEPIDYLYFPNEAVVSVMASTEEGQNSAVGMIGNEGVVGIDALMGATSSPHTFSALYGDGAHRLRLSELTEPLTDCGPLHEAMLRSHSVSWSS